MPDFQLLDRCPFCDAIWGDCEHARLFEEWEAEAAEREAATTRLVDEAQVCPKGLKPQTGRRRSAQ